MQRIRIVAALACGFVAVSAFGVPAPSPRTDDANALTLTVGESADGLDTDADVLMINGNAYLLDA